MLGVSSVRRGDGDGGYPPHLPPHPQLQDLLGCDKQGDKVMRRPAIVSGDILHYRRSGNRQDKENTLAIILVSIVMVFFTCHSLKFFLVLYKASSNPELMHPNNLISRSM